VQGEARVAAQVERLAASHIEPNHRSPSAMNDSMPLIRGDPSRRSIAIVRWGASVEERAHGLGELGAVASISRQRATRRS
jgi:hypothetical protein